VTSSARIFHVTSERDWHAAQQRGSYVLSTRDRTLEEVGFIHCSYANQVAGVANAIYRGEHHLVLLVIDPQRLTAPLRPEPPAPGMDAYPHIYGPLNLEAVVNVVAYEPAEDGTFSPPELPA
jgi:uncharacterized protein (DUF952 family)